MPFVGFIIIAASFAFALPAHGQVDIGLQYAEGIGLPMSDIRIIVTNIIRSVLGFTGLVFMLQLLWGGFLMMTHGGNQEMEDAAKATISNSIIGVILVGSSASLARFVVNAIVNATQTYL